MLYSVFIFQSRIGVDPRSFLYPGVLLWSCYAHSPIFYWDLNPGIYLTLGRAIAPAVSRQEVTATAIV
jgi:hypothetical protein